MRNTIPEAARRIGALLSSKGYSARKHLVLDTPVTIRQVIDMPGVLDFFEPTVTEIWPFRKTVGFLCKGSGTVHIVENTDDDYGDGNYVRARWDLSALNGAVLSLVVPVGTLALPEGVRVSFRNAEGGHEPFDLVEVGRAEGLPLISYRDGKGNLFRDFARDLHPGDIREVLSAIGHPVA